MLLKMSELNNFDTKTINDKVSELRKDLFNLKLKKNTTSLEKSHDLIITKKNIARLLTAKNSKVSK